MHRTTRKDQYPWAWQGTSATAPSSFPRRRRVLEVERLEDRQLLAAGGGIPSTFVDNLYKDLLHRTPEPDGRAYWMAQLDHGATPADVAGGIANSTEARYLLINDLYRALLDRDGEAAGLAYWNRYLAAGGMVQGLTVQFLVSPEYADRTEQAVDLSGAPVDDFFIDHLYTDVLHRSPSPPEVAAWAAAGVSHAQMALGFVTSPEASQGTVSGWYQTYLRRAPDVPGAATWQSLLALGADARWTLGLFLGSAEYVHRPDATAATPSEAVNRLAADLYARLSGQAGNLAFSPASIELALALAYAGARGQTADEMASVLHLGPNSAATHEAVGALMRQLVADGTGPGSTLEAADALWGQTGYPFRADFLQGLQAAYGAAFQNADFAANPEQARSTINDWVARLTHDKIQDLLPQGTVDTLTRLVLANAVYFLGDWAQPFEPDSTHDGGFALSPGQTASVPLMNQTADFRYGDQDGVQTLEMPYAGGRFAMDVLLPEQADGLGRLEGQLTAENLGKWTAGLPSRPVDVTLPRFQTTSAFDLKAVLSALGMATAFDPAAADFSGMNGGQDRLDISHVLHKAYVSVGEKGTEAAAATGVVFQLLSGLIYREPPVVFRADHPFVYLIRDTGSNTVLFVGRVSDPRPSG